MAPHSRGVLVELHAAQRTAFFLHFFFAISGLPVCRMRGTLYHKTFLWAIYITLHRIIVHALCLVRRAYLGANTCSDGVDFRLDSLCMGYPVRYPDGINVSQVISYLVSHGIDISHCVPRIIPWCTTSRSYGTPWDIPCDSRLSWDTLILWGENVAANPYKNGRTKTWKFLSSL